MVSKKSSSPLVLLATLGNSTSLVFPSSVSMGKGIRQERETLTLRNKKRAAQQVPPGCDAPYPELIGDGECRGELYTEECEWDGGDCNEFNARVSVSRL